MNVLAFCTFDIFIEDVVFRFYRFVFLRYLNKY